MNEINIDGDKLYEVSTGENLNDIDEITQDQLKQILDKKSPRQRAKLNNR